jgi:hypothetical protein
VDFADDTGGDWGVERVDDLAGEDADFDFIDEDDLIVAGDEDNWDFKDEYDLIEDLGEDDLFTLFFNLT